MTTDAVDLVLHLTCVRKGTLIWIPHPNPPPGGGGNRTLSQQQSLLWQDRPTTSSSEKPVESLAPIESIHPGNVVLDHSGQMRRVAGVIRKVYRGTMIGLRHALTPKTLWLTADHLVLCKPRPRSLGGQRNWSGSPPEHLERRRQLRREAGPAERRLWSALRQGQLGVKFRRQHPIGPYIADFYSREAHLVVEVDGATHFEAEAIERDAVRDAYMRDIGLDVLRVTTLDVLHNLEGVCMAIENLCRIRTQSIEGSEWVQAARLLPGDLVFHGPRRCAVTIDAIESICSEEEVYDLEVENGSSFLTEVCAVHSCGCGTNAHVAEQ